MYNLLFKHKFDVLIGNENGTCDCYLYSTWFFRNTENTHTQLKPSVTSTIHTPKAMSLLRFRISLPHALFVWTCRILRVYVFVLLSLWIQDDRGQGAYALMLFSSAFTLCISLLLFFASSICPPLLCLSLLLSPSRSPIFASRIIIIIHYIWSDLMWYFVVWTIQWYTDLCVCVCASYYILGNSAILLQDDGVCGAHFRLPFPKIKFIVIVFSI